MGQLGMEIRPSSSGPDVEHGPSVADRLFSVLEACSVSRQPSTLAQLSESTGLPKSTLHRICWKLVDLGALEDSGGGFRIGPRIYALGSTSPDLQRLRALSGPLMHALASHTGWIVNLGVLCERRVLLVDEVAPAVQFKPRERMVGRMLPLHATALGKVLLAHAPDEVREGVLDASLLRPFTRRTIIRTSLLRDHLADIAGHGYALSRGEFRVGVGGVAAPVIVNGALAAAIALVGAADEATLRGLSGHARLAADRLADSLASYGQGRPQTSVGSPRVATTAAFG